VLKLTSSSMISHADVIDEADEGKLVGKASWVVRGLALIDLHQFFIGERGVLE
jgi:hypothetical protein